MKEGQKYPIVKVIKDCSVEIDLVNGVVNVVKDSKVIVKISRCSLAELNKPSAIFYAEYPTKGVMGRYETRPNNKV